MLRVFLLASLLVVAFADHHEDDHDDDHHGCCSHEDRIEIQHLWQSVWESSFTDRKLQIGKAIFTESVNHFISHRRRRRRHHHLCRRHFFHHSEIQLDFFLIFSARFCLSVYPSVCHSITLVSHT